MIHDERLDIIGESFAKLEMRPIEVIAHLERGSRIMGDHPLNLDNILAYCIVGCATNWDGLQEFEDGYWIPLPLKLLWQNDLGFPLWDSSSFIPDQHIEDVIYMHKRAISGTLSSMKGTRTNTSGRFMDRRKPCSVLVTNSIRARCVGNKDIIEELLSKFVTYIGKKRNIGLAKVLRWEVLDCDFDTSIYNDGRLTRNVPGKFIDDITNLVLRGWTPPEWKPSLFSLCAGYGQKVKRESFTV